MDVCALLSEFFDRLPPLVERTVRGLSAEQLAWAPVPGANSIGWLTWHLTRVQDDHVAELMGVPQVYSAEHAKSFGLTDLDETGYAHTPEQAAAVLPEGPEAVMRYFTAVADRTREYLSSLTPDSLDEVVDSSWDPPVTRGIRLASVVNDDDQHAGQAAYVRGLLP